MKPRILQLGLGLLAALVLGVAWWGWTHGGLALLQVGLGHCF